MTLTQEAAGTMPNPITISCGVAAHAVVRVAADRVDDLRKSPPGARGTALSNGFLRHVDAQTVVVLAAIDRAVRDGGLTGPQQAGEFSRWGVIAAPRFLGRAALTPAISRYHTEGAWGVSPHLVPHRSLHSISGTVSQVHGMHGPNFGVGGGPGAEMEGLIAAAATLDSMNLPGVWLVLSRVEPDLPPVEGHKIDPESSVQALALALVPETTLSPARLEMTLGLTKHSPALAFDLDTLAGLFDRLRDHPEVASPLGETGRIVLRQSSSVLAGPHAFERYQTLPTAPVEIERRFQP